MRAFDPPMCREETLDFAGGHLDTCTRGRHEIELAEILSTGAVACRIPHRLASPRHHCRGDARRLCDPGVAGLCRACGLPPQIGIYGYMLGGIGYALLGSSRQLAVGPTSAISLMIAATVGVLAAGDAVRYAQIASMAPLRLRSSA
jgi:hypothetical protein